jgi:hypothetical protein
MDIEYIDDDGEPIQHIASSEPSQTIIVEPSKPSLTSPTVYVMPKVVRRDRSKPSPIPISDEYFRLVGA